MRLYRFQGTETGSPVSAWISETAEYQNMMAAAGRWFADSLEEALWYECDHEDGVVLCLDLDDDQAEKWRVSNMPRRPGGRDTPENPSAWSLRPEREFFLPVEIAATARQMDPAMAHETEEAAPRM